MQERDATVLKVRWHAKHVTLLMGKQTATSLAVLALADKLDACDFRLAGRGCAGTPFPPYLHYLTQFNKAELEARAHEIIKKFQAHVQPEITDV